MSIADVVYKTRIERGLTSQQMADLMGCKQPYISMIEWGERIPSRKWVARFAKEFGLDSDKLELLCGRVPEDKLKDVCKQLLEEKG